jgi:hypothetical protein
MFKWTQAAAASKEQAISFQLTAVSLLATAYCLLTAGFYLCCNENFSFTNQGLQQVAEVIRSICD